MKANKEKLELAMAKACMSMRDIADKAKMPEPSVKNVLYGRSVTPRTLGRVCRALDVDVEKIIETEG